MAESKNNRVVYLDLLRTVTVFSMMLLHVATSKFYTIPVSSFTWQVSNIYNCCVHFCVPVFFMISGVFMLDPERPLTMKKLFTKNILRIVTAYIFWSLVYTLYIYLPAGQTSAREMFFYFVKGHYHLWFLFTIVSLYIITPCLRKITEDIRMQGYFILLFAFFCLLLNALKANRFLDALITPVTDSLHIDFVIGYTGYYMLGNFLYRSEISKPVRLILYAAGIACALFTIISTSILSLNSGSFNAFWNNYLLPNIAVISAAIFVFFQYEVVRIKWSERQLSGIYLLAKLSFGMYLVHDLFNDLLSALHLTILTYNPIFSIPGNTILVFALSFVVSYAISKIPLLNKYII